MLLRYHLYDTVQNAQTYGRHLAVNQLHLPQKTHEELTENNKRKMVDI